MKNDEELKAGIQRLKAQVEAEEKIWLEYGLRKRAKEKPPGLLSKVIAIFKSK